MDEEKIRRMENDLVAALAILEWIQLVLNGEEASDFALSFPIVREVSDLKVYETRMKTKVRIG